MTIGDQREVGVTFQQDLGDVDAVAPVKLRLRLLAA